MRRVLLLVTALAAAGLLTVFSGVLPLHASSGHWPITRWALQFVKERTVAARAVRIAVPPLDDPALALRGAGHYESGCRRCHGVPGEPPPALLRYMLPRPPDLRPILRRYDSAELFFIVKHGIKFTGMPGWPVQNRDDEVWAMVAFLRQLPGTTPADYARLVFGDTPRARPAAAPADAPPVVAAACARCHGIDGLGRGSEAFPKLAGQRPLYLYEALRAYASGARSSGTMSPIAANLADADMRETARYFASLPGLATAPATAETADAGALIAAKGVPARDVPSCADCHGPGAEATHPAYPVLGGQYRGYLAQQIGLFHRRQRGGSAYAHLMHPAADGLTPEQVRAVAAYYGGMAADGAEAEAPPEP